ncbi:MAG TPA: thioesterase domain-containing protein [Ktedonobacteraceae bacterium]|nr:thioesterase domain-containing protein [Ktedonobacteraceae bacterium]
MTNTSPLWFAYRRPRPYARLRLFCLPYAGGSASIYRQWPELLPPQIDVWPLQLPGRENRLQEPAIHQMSEMIAMLVSVMRPYLDVPYAFFGHSMGAGIAFELVHALVQEQCIPPLHLFVSGRRAPQMPQREEMIHALPEPAFVEKLRDMEGTPEEVLQNTELLQLVLPALRADFTLSETYSRIASDPLTIPISAYGGLQDKDVTRADLLGWQQQTRAAFKLRFFPGNHFFLHSARKALVEALTRELSAYL